MNDCYIKVEGGLGNQLFMIAAAYAYSQKYNKNLYIDDSKWTASQGNPPIIYANTIFKNFQYKHSEDCVDIYDKFGKFKDLPYVDGNVSIHGYCQSIKYFENYKDEFINLLNFPKVDTWFLKLPNVIFHIRRGDYIRYPRYYICNSEYFNSQFEKFKGFQINVCTDSIEHIVKEFKTFNFNILQTSSELIDFMYATKHQNMVCSNSSFSWWASLIGNMDKIIVPDKWLNDNTELDIYREDMIKVKV